MNNFRIVSIELVDGKPKVVWEPKTNRWTGAEILAVLKGAAARRDGSPHRAVAQERDPPVAVATSCDPPVRRQAPPSGRICVIHRRAF